MADYSVDRAFPRRPCAAAVEVFQDGKHCAWGEANDISRSGCYIETVTALPLGTEVELRLTIAGVSLEIGARVVWTTPQVGMGMFFQKVSLEAERHLSQILEGAAATGHPPVAQQAEAPQQPANPQQPGSAKVRITREAAPEILSKIIVRVNEKGVLTRQELIEIVKASQ
jgi:hypothetical protein